MAKHILKELPELVRANVITEQTAEKIQVYYKEKNISPPENKMILVFAVLGAALVGMGLILIIAHNWDDFSKLTKTVLSFVPLVTGQLVCGYVLLSKKGGKAWREGAAVFLTFAVGAVIALVAQIYHLHGDFRGFMLTWIMLCLPLVYIMQSSMTSLLYIIGITIYAWAGNWLHGSAYSYWLLLFLILPHYYQLYKNSPNSNFTTFHHWFLSLSIVDVMATFIQGEEEWGIVTYISLFGLLYLIGNSRLFTGIKLRNNAYLVVGALGTVVLLMFLSFDWYWDDLSRHTLTFTSEAFVFTAVISVLSFAMLCYQLYSRKSQILTHIRFMEVAFILFIVTFIVGSYLPNTAIVFVNIMLFFLGVSAVRKGAINNHLGVLNYGLLVIAALVTCRFFDRDISFILRGVLFMLVGAGFFFANYWIIKKRKINEQ